MVIHKQGKPASAEEEAAPVTFNKGWGLAGPSVPLKQAGTTGQAPQAGTWPDPRLHTV